MPCRSTFLCQEEKIRVDRQVVQTAPHISLLLLRRMVGSRDRSCNYMESETCHEEPRVMPGGVRENKSAAGTT